MKFLRIFQYASEFGVTDQHVAEMIHRFYVENGDGFINTETLTPERIIENPERYYILCEDDGEFVAVGAIRVATGRIMHVCVRKDRRRQGFGKILVALLASVGLKRNIAVDAVVNKSNLASRRLFESLGFKMCEDTEKVVGYVFDLRDMHELLENLI